MSCHCQAIGASKRQHADDARREPEPEEVDAGHDRLEHEEQRPPGEPKPRPELGEERSDFVHE